MASEARSAELTIIISHLTSASGIIVSLKTPTKYRETKKSVITYRAVVLLHGLFAPMSFRPGNFAHYFRTRNFIFEACLFWFMALRTRNITYKARLVRFMAYRSRNLTFEAR